MSKRKVHNNQFLNLNDKKSYNSGIDSKKSMNSGSEYKMKQGKEYQPDLLFDNDLDEPGLVNRNYWYRGELMQLVPDVFKELANNSEVVIEQKIELLEILTGCETPNRYNVYLLDKEKNKKFLFKCKEESSWCCRNCCPSSSRSFNLRMIHIKNANKRADYKKTIADFERPFKCTCCCLGRPEMDAFFTNDGTYDQNNGRGGRRSTLMGKVKEPCSISPQMIVAGEDCQPRWRIIGDYCQCGYCLRDISVGKCYEVDFWIYDIDAEVENSKPVGNVHKVFKGLSELITDSDAFILTFPKKATPIERILLIGAVIMIDYRYYESLAMCDCGSII